VKDQGKRARGSLPSVHWGKAIFENAPVGIAVAALDGRFLTANTAFQRMVGYTEAELHEFTPLDLTEEADRAAASERLNQLRTGVARDYQVEKRYRCKEASLRPDL
jgi:PAS domain S-box-containing protein